MKKIKEKLSSSFTLVKWAISSLNNEREESMKMMGLILKKYSGNSKLTEKETFFIVEQAKDMGKLSVLVPFVILPFSPITIPVLYKVANKLNIDLTPSSFKKEELIEENKNIELEGNNNFLYDKKDIEEMEDVNSMSRY